MLMHWHSLIRLPMTRLPSAMHSGSIFLPVSRAAWCLCLWACSRQQGLCRLVKSKLAQKARNPSSQLNPLLLAPPKLRRAHILHSRRSRIIPPLGNLAASLLLYLACSQRCRQKEAAGRKSAVTSLSAPSGFCWIIATKLGSLNKRPRMKMRRPTVNNRPPPQCSRHRAPTSPKDRAGQPQAKGGSDDLANHP